jgi:hypothetical protein
MKYTEQDLKDEYEQAVKRKGELYAEGYIEGIKDAQNQALTIPDAINWVAVSEQTPPEGEWVITGHNVDKWVDRASYHGGSWENGECDIYPTHWALIEPPCL